MWTCQCVCSHHHHHVTLSARIFLTLSCHPFPIVHRFWQVFHTTSSICTELLYVCSSWTSCLCSSLWKGPQEYITYELVPTSPAVFRMSGSSNFDSFHDGWSVAVQLLFCGVLSPGLVQNCSQHSCVVFALCKFSILTHNVNYISRPKTMDSEAVVQAIEANPEGSTLRESGKHSISESSVVYHLHDFGKCIRSC